MGDLSAYKEELQSLLQYALQEYGNAALRKRDLIENGHASESIGSFTAEITMLVSETNRFQLRRYDVVSDDGAISFSFILGHAAILFANSARKFREDLLRNEHIKGVATLKQSVFDHIVIPAAIILLDKESKETWLTSAESIDQLSEIFCDRFESQLKVYRTDKISSNNMLPEYYNGDEDIIEEKLSGTHVKELGDIATVISGKGARSAEYVDEGIPYLRARDIKDGKLLKTAVCLSPDNVEKYSRQLLQEGDILLTKHFGQNKLAYVTDDDLPAIASNMLFIIRPFDVPEGYLYRYLTSSTGQEIFNKQINRIQRGVSVPSVSLSDLIHVEVPILDEKTMQSIEYIDTISSEEAVATTRNLLLSYACSSENEMEKTVKNALLGAGWDSKRFVDKKKAVVSIGNGRKLIPDFAYQLEDGRKVIIEAKSDLGNLRPDWIKTLQHIINGDGDYFFILTTGMIYEIHIPGVKNTLQMISPPTIEDILKWEKEVH